MSVAGFRCDVAERGYRLLVAGITAAEGLALLDPQATPRVCAFGATGYERHGWATEKDLPSFDDVAQLRALVARPGLGLLELDVAIEQFGRVTSRDDSSCAFYVDSRAALHGLVTQLLPAPHVARGINTLLGNSGAYFAWSEAGGLTRSPQPSGLE